MESIMMGGEEGSFSFIAQTTGVSLIPSFLGRDREMRGLFSPPSVFLSPAGLIIFTPFSTTALPRSPLCKIQRRRGPSLHTSSFRIRRFLKN